MNASGTSRPLREGTALEAFAPADTDGELEPETLPDEPVTDPDPPLDAGAAVDGVLGVTPDPEPWLVELGGPCPPNGSVYWLSPALCATAAAGNASATIAAHDAATRVRKNIALSIADRPDRLQALAHLGHKTRDRTQGFAR